MDSDLSGVKWRKSRHSGGAQSCIEVADNLPGVVGVRDSKNRNGPTLVFSRQEWNSFIANLKLDNSAN